MPSDKTPEQPYEPPKAQDLDTSEGAVATAAMMDTSPGDDPSEK